MALEIEERFLTFTSRPIRKSESGGEGAGLFRSK